MTAPARESLLIGSSWLGAVGVDSAGVDAQLLLAHVLGVSRGALLPSTPVSEEQQARFEELLARRVRREPLQHILGDAAFRHVVVAVGPGVFVPRPETELLVDAVLPVLRAAQHPVAVDLCSGSGALALALADEVSQARVLAVENAASALDWLRRNAAGGRVEVVDADVTDPAVLPDLRGQVDAVVCNPPYVPTDTEVGVEVQFDPPEAVFAGADGLALMSAVADRAAELLRPGGVLAVEHDDTQGEAVPALLRAHGAFADVADHRDLTGRARYAVATHT